MAICAMVVGGGACGRIGYDRIGAVRDGGVGGTGGAITGAGGAVTGAGGSAGSAGDGGSFGSGGSGDGGVLVDGGGSCVNGPAPCGTIRLQYRCGDVPKPSDPWIRPQINLFNDSGADVPLAELTVRYWYTIDAVAAQMFACDAAILGSAGCANLTSAFSTVSPPRAGGDSLLEIGFLPAAGTLVAGGQTQGIIMRVNKTDFSTYDELNDFSYTSSSTFADAIHITVYRNGTLVWGVEPP